MRRSKLVCVVVAGGLALGACSPAAEPSSVPPGPGTPPPGWEAGKPGADMAPNPAADRVFAEQTRASQERVVLLAKLAERKGLEQLRTPARDLRERAVTTIRAVSDVEEAAPEDAQVEETEGLPSEKQLRRIGELDGPAFRDKWVSEMRGLQQFTLQLANNQTDLGQHGRNEQWFALAQRMSSEAQTALAQLNALR